MKKVILATQSKQRQELLTSLGFPFEAIAADIDELTIQDKDDVVRARKVAEAKAAKMRSQFPDAIIIAADTFIVCNGERLEKPLDLAEARRMLTTLSGNNANSHTGWSYSDPAGQIAVSSTTSTQVIFRQLSSQDIERYVTSYPVTSWAGAFSAYHLPGMALIGDLRGSLTALLGLPIEELIPLLQKSGVLI